MPRRVRCVTDAQKKATTKLLDKLIAKDALNLPDWTIVIKWEPMIDISKFIDPTETFQAYGYAQWNADDQTAVITLAYPHELIESNTTTAQVLVHELLHVRIGGQKTCDYDVHDERTINALTPLVCKALKLK